MNENDHCKITHIASAYYKEIQSWGWFLFVFFAPKTSPLYDYAICGAKKEPMCFCARSLMLHYLKSKHQRDNICTHNAASQWQSCFGSRKTKISSSLELAMQPEALLFGCKHRIHAWQTGGVSKGKRTACRWEHKSYRRKMGQIMSK